MKSTYARFFQASRRCVNWCNANTDVIPPASGPAESWPSLTRQAHTLGVLVADIADAAAEQEVQGNGMTLVASNDKSLREHLRTEMHSVTQVAQALRSTIPGIGNLSMPEPSLRTEDFLSSADALIRLAATQAGRLEVGEAY